MKKTFGLLCFLALSISPAIAQEAPTTETPSQEAPKQEAPKQDTSGAAAPKQAIPKYEINASYTFRHFTEQDGTALAMNGWTASGVRRWRSWLNAEVSLSGAYARTAKLHAPSTREYIYTAFVGPRFYLPGQHKLTPFVHIMFGAGYYHRYTSAYGDYPGGPYWDLDYAWELGAGVDLRLRHSSHWAVHLIQFDSDHTRFIGGYSGQSNYRLSTGITYRFGKR